MVRKKVSSTFVAENITCADYLLGTGAITKAEWNKIYRRIKYWYVI